MSTTSEKTCYVEGKPNKNIANIIMSIRGHAYTIKILSNALSQVSINSPHYTALKASIDDSSLVLQELRDLLSVIDTDTE